MNKILKWWEHVLIHINWSQFSRSSSARPSSLLATVGKVDRFSKWTWHWCPDSFFSFSYVMTFKSFISVYRCKFKKKLTLDKLYSDHFQILNLPGFLDKFKSATQCRGNLFFAPDKLSWNIFIITVFADWLAFAYSIKFHFRKKYIT